MDNQEKNLGETTSESLGGKTTQQTTKSEANQQGCPSHSQNQLPNEVKKERWRLDVPIECRDLLQNLSNELDVRSMGSAVCWLLPNNPEMKTFKTLVDLTRDLGYQKGGQTIEWLLSLIEPILTLSKKLGFQIHNAEETLNWSLPTRTQLLLELTRMLGMRNGGETLDYLISKEIQPLLSSATNIPAQFQPQTSTFQHSGGADMLRSSSKQQQVFFERIPKLPAFGPSAANHSVPTLTQPRESTLREMNATDSLYPGRVNAQPHYHLQSSVSNIANLSNFKRRGINAGHGDPGGTQIQTSYRTEGKGKQPINQAGKTTPVQGLSNSTVNAVDVGFEPRGYIAGMLPEIAVVNGKIVTSDYFHPPARNQESMSPPVTGDYFHPPARNQESMSPLVTGDYFHPPARNHESMSPLVSQGIRPQYEFENIQRWSQYQNFHPPARNEESMSPPVSRGIGPQYEFETEMGGGHGGSGRPPSAME